MDFSIRHTTIEDIPRLVEIIRAAFYRVAVRFDLNEENCPKHPSNCKDEWIKETLIKGVQYFILEAEGISYGCVALEQAGPQVCYMERLAVLPDQQGQGFGRALVNHVLKEAGGLGTSQVDIGIIAKHLELKEWYKKIGFQEHRRARFLHLPFEVLFMSIPIKKTGR